MRIDIVSDFVCPWCYIGKRRLQKVLEMRPALKPEIKWRPFSLNPDVPVEGRPLKEHYEKKFGGPDGMARTLSTMRAAASQEGLEFHFDKIERVPHTMKAQVLVRLAGESGVQPVVAEALFKAYLVEGLDISDNKVLMTIAEAAGVAHPELETELNEGASRKMVEREIAAAVSMGVNLVPTYLLNQKYAILGVKEPYDLLEILDAAYAEERASLASAEASAPQASSLS